MEKQDQLLLERAALNDNDQAETTAISLRLIDVRTQLDKTLTKVSGQRGGRLIVVRNQLDKTLTKVSGEGAGEKLEKVSLLNLITLCLIRPHFCIAGSLGAPPGG